MKRYTLWWEYMREDPDGDWVKYKDAKEVLEALEEAIVYAEYAFDVLSGESAREAEEEISRLKDIISKYRGLRNG